MEIVQRFQLDASPERVGQVLCSEAFNVGIERQRQEVLNTEYRLIEQSADGIHFEVRSEEYKRGKTGRLIRGETVHSQTRHRFSAAERTLSWDYTGVGSKWVTVQGVYHLNPVGEGTDLEHRVQIDVHLPLLGSQIAKLVAKEFEKAFARFERQLRRHLSQSPPTSNNSSSG